MLPHVRTKGGLTKKIDRNVKQWLERDSQQLDPRADLVLSLPMAVL